MNTQTALRLGGPVLVLATFLWGIELSDIDLLIQDWIFRLGNQAWPLGKSDSALRLFFYDGPKIVLVAIAIGLSIALLWSFRKGSATQHRRPMAFVLVILALVPATASLGKALTNISCPLALERYGGAAPYVRLFERAPDKGVQAKRGRCFPAGHASGGFALISLFFAFNRRFWRRAGLTAGLGVGWLMGGYQMLIGAHFFSHTVATMMLAWILCVLIEPLVLKKTGP